MTETSSRPEPQLSTAREQYGGHPCAGMPAAPPPCPFGRRLSYATGQYSIMFGYEDLTRIMERILDIWDHLENRHVVDEEAGDMFESLLGHLDQTRAWTGWGGVPGKFLR